MVRVIRPLIAFLLVQALATPACARPMPAFRAAAVAHGKLSKVGAQWVLELDGTPEERGKAAGALVGEQLRWILPRYLKQVLSTTRLAPDQKETVAAIAAGLPQPHFDQLNALAEAAGVDRTALFAVNLAPEASSALACSCLATEPGRSIDGKVRLARNLDWDGGELLSGAALIVIESGGPHRFASFTWPGLVGVATGMNDAGLSVADLMALGTREKARPGVPVLFAVRSMLERSDSVDGALEWLKNTSRTIPQNYALGDAKSARVVETSSGVFRVRASAGGLAAITNFWGEEQGGAKDGRYAGMLQAAGERRLGVKELQDVLRDAALGDSNVQSLVMEPGARRALVAQGRPPVARGSWAAIDLSAWLGPAPEAPSVQRPEVNHRQLPSTQPQSAGSRAR